MLRYCTLIVLFSFSALAQVAPTPSFNGTQFFNSGKYVYANDLNAGKDYAIQQGAAQGAASALATAATLYQTSAQVAAALAPYTNTAGMIARMGASVLDYCSPMALTGTTDNTACIQAAVTAVCAIAAGKLYFPAAPYAINAATGVTIPCEGVNLQGAGWGDPSATATGTLINVIGSGSAPIFNFNGAQKGDAGRYSLGGKLDGMYFAFANSGATATQTGAAVAISYCESCEVSHIYTYGSSRSVTVFAGLGTRVHDFRFSQVRPGGEAVKYYGSDSGCSDLGSCATRGDIFQIDHGVIDAALVTGTIPPACIRISDFAATTMISQVACNQVAIGLNVDCPTSGSIAACPQFISAFDFETETNGLATPSNAAGLVLSDVVNFFCHDCQIFGYNTQTNVIAQSVRFAGASNIQFFGGKIESAQGSCVISSAQALEIHGGQIANCNQANVSGNGVELRANSVGGATASGSNIIEGVRMCFENGTIPTNMGGVLLTAGTDYNMITNNIFRGCVAGYSDGSGGTHNVIANNSGI